ncbi:MAG: ATP-binding domain-containing protein [Rhodocyclaceae bacterium]|nr:ATP-binding domain-containing protein [Rhodocyclaceae bacterium]
MAKIYPDGWRELEASGAAAREIATLARFEAALSDDYAVYHAVHWTTVEQGHSIYGEVSFAIVNRAGAVLLIEQMSGLLDESPEGLVKRYPGKRLSVPVRIGRTLQVLGRKLAERTRGAAVTMEYLLYCPDYTVREPATAGLAPERIVDAACRDRLVARIVEVLGPGEAAPQADSVHRFLRDIIQLEPDVSALVGQARTLVNRVSGGLAHWARQLDMAPFRLRVTGTAGSGKTQLALAEYRAAVEAGRTVLYVCYNRPLADHIRAIAPAGGRICTFHMLCDQFVRSHGLTPDFAAPGAFERLVESAAGLVPGPDFLFDTVIVDEGQDFPERWRDLVFRHARPEARLLWLEDPLQNLYGREPVQLPGWVGLRARGNYRSPRAIVRLLAELMPEADRPEARSPFERGEVDFLVFEDDDALEARVREAVRQCYAAGFRAEDTALITFRGREHSRLLGRDSLGRVSLRRFTGRYDLFGSPEFSPGELLVESVYRFKGQAAPAVVLAEVDFERLDDRAMRKLFVGATRAMMKLVVVVSPRAHALLAERGIA